jgi:hypothetical protein
VQLLQALVTKIRFGNRSRCGQGLLIEVCIFNLMLFTPTSKSKSRPVGSLSFSAGVAMLLFFYVAAFVYSPVGVPHSHHEDEIHSGDICHTDACHISIYHPGSKGGCNHKSHITQAMDECDMCNVILPRQIVSSTLLHFDFDIAFAFSPVFIFNEMPLVEVSQHSDRGPPSVIS